METFNTTLENFLKECEKIANQEISERLTNIVYSAMELQRGRIIDDVLEKMRGAISTKVQTFHEYGSSALKVNVTFEIKDQK